MKFIHNVILPYKSLSLVLSDFFFGNIFLIYFFLNNYIISIEHLLINILNIILACLFRFYKHYQNTIDINIFKNIVFIFIPTNTILLYLIYDNLLLSLLYSYLFWLSVLVSRITIIKIKHLLINRDVESCMVIGCNMAARHVGRVLLDSPNKVLLGYIKTNNDNLGDRIDTFKVYDFKSIDKLIKNKKVTLFYLPNDLILNLDEKKYIAKIRKNNIKIKNTKNIAQIIEYSNDNLIETLISRSEYKIKKSELSHFKDKNILLCGGGGSIGSQLVSVLVESTNAKIFVIDNSERALFELKQYLGDNASRVKFILGDIRFINAIHFDINPSDFSFIINAAAYKHVSFVQSNSWEGFDVNFIGTQSLLDFRKKYNIYRFIQISTDKAVNPTTIMGLTKRLAEMAVLVDEYQNKDQSEMINTIVRFGNVLGSSGSVIPIFQDLISNKKPITVFDKQLNRYMMTINEAVSLVLIATKFHVKKSIFLLDMGKEVSILELAKKMIISNGYQYTFEKPMYNEIQIKFGKLPDYEKLSEVLYDNVLPNKSDHSKILYIEESINEKNVHLLTKINKMIVHKDIEKLLNFCLIKKIYIN